MWESAKTVAPTSNSAIIQLDVDDNFVINSTHLNMIWESKFDGYLQADPHDHIHEFLAIRDMLKYRETQNDSTQAILDVTAGGIFLYKSLNQAFQLLEDKVLFSLDWSFESQNDHHQKFVSFTVESDSNDDNFRLTEKLEALTIKMDSQIISLNKELLDICNKYNELREGTASKNHLNDDRPMYERHEANIRSEDYQNQDSHNSFSCQSHHDPNNLEKSFTGLNNDVRNDLEDFKRRIHSMRTVH
nr:reverse transcriptase domain-containing protein [Tanacetum cinerariifolium]